MLWALWHHEDALTISFDMGVVSGQLGTGSRLNDLDRNETKKTSHDVFL